MNSTNLQALDKALSGFAGKKVNDLIVDLRASAATSDLSLAAEFAKRFCPKGKPIFTLRKPAGHQDRVFSSEREPAFRGLLMVLADGETAGAAEAIAAALRFYNKALVIGQPTAGRAAEYSDLLLPDGKIVRLAVAEMVSPEGRSLFPEGLKPDLPVEMSLAGEATDFSVEQRKRNGSIHLRHRPAAYDGSGAVSGHKSRIGGRGSGTATPRSSTGKTAAARSSITACSGCSDFAGSLSKTINGGHQVSLCLDKAYLDANSWFIGVDAILQFSSESVA